MCPYGASKGYNQIKTNQLRRQKMKKLLVLSISVLTSATFIMIGCAAGGDTALLESSAGSTASHKAGQSCMKSGCHGSGGPAFTIAGTITVSDGGAVDTSGRTITITGKGSLVSDGNGNFYSNDSKYSGTVATGNISTSGGTKNLTTIDLSGTGGNCNQGGACHGGGQNLVF